MAGAFSGHLVNSYLESLQSARGPFNQPNSLEISTRGAMSFAPQMHGFYGTQQPFTQTSMELSEETAKNIATLQAKLDKKLGPEYISTRPGPGGGPKLTYAEGWKIINLANEVFGFNGWSSSIINLTTDYIDFNEDSKRYNVGATAIVRVTLRDGVFHEDVGYGNLENSKNKGQALDKCKKEAVTDAVKRALRNFGNLLGNCLYDKHYAQEIVKIKVPPPKFDKGQLHRRPEFDENRAGPSTSTTNYSSTSVPVVKTESAPNTSMPAARPQSTISAVTPHTRAASGNQIANGGPGTTTSIIPSHNGKLQQVASANGLDTPAHTPVVPRTGATGVQGQQPPEAQSHGRQTEAPAPHQRRVSFAPPCAANSNSGSASAPQPVPGPSKAAQAETEHMMDDDSFHFNSEDDVFLATVDLGDEGLGGPIHFDEGTGGIDESTDITSELSVLRTEGLSKRAASIAAQLQADERLQDAQDHDRQQSHEHHAGAAQQQARLVQAPAQQQYPRPQVPWSRMPSAANPTHKQQTSHTNQNIPPPDAHQFSSSSLQGNSGTRASTPSIGGFNFPPGVTPHNLRPGAPPPSRVPGQTGQGFSSGIGLKRSADVMQAQSGGKRLAQGMNLTVNAGGYSAQHASGMKREPFAQLDLGEGRDVKRARR